MTTVVNMVDKLSSRNKTTVSVKYCWVQYWLSNVNCTIFGWSAKM